MLIEKEEKNIRSFNKMKLINKKYAKISEKITFPFP
jgi:hypothetical protein